MYTGVRRELLGVILGRPEFPRGPALPAGPAFPPGRTEPPKGETAAAAAIPAVKSAAAHTGGPASAAPLIFRPSTTRFSFRAAKGRTKDDAPRISAAKGTTSILRRFNQIS